MKSILVFAALLLSACGGGPSGPAPAGDASVSGVVKSLAGDAIEGASVSIGSRVSTTDANGWFELQEVPSGSVTIIVRAPRFEDRSLRVSLVAGANLRDFVLDAQTLFTYEHLVAYLSADVAAFRAAIVFLPGLRDPVTGNALDSRGLVRGTADPACSIWCAPQEKAEVRKRALELLGGNVALLGTTTLEDNSGSYQAILTALAAFGTQSGHPELATIPIVFVGHSMGGCTAYGFTRAHGARVAGFLTMKGGCHNQGPAAAAASVPGYFLIGGLDEQYRRDNITGVFEAGRRNGAPWAVSIDELQHNPIADMDMMFDWIAAVLAARLPETPDAPLLAVTESDGWLGNRTNGTIASYACFNSAASSASWLPSEKTALNWQQMARGTGAVGSC